MSVVIKRSDKDSHIPLECRWGCCTPVHGKDVKKIRRAMKRSQRQDARKQIEDERNDTDDT